MAVYRLLPLLPCQVGGKDVACRSHYRDFEFGTFYFDIAFVTWLLRSHCINVRVIIFSEGV